MLPSCFGVLFAGLRLARILLMVTSSLCIYTPFPLATLLCKCSHLFLPRLKSENLPILCMERGV
ncbi:hypothetical protein LINPERPRIM_LOCUS8052 [Linum perenne]